MDEGRARGKRGEMIQKFEYVFGFYVEVMKCKFSIHNPSWWHNFSEFNYNIQLKQKAIVKTFIYEGDKIFVTIQNFSLLQPRPSQ